MKTFKQFIKEAEEEENSSMGIHYSHRPNLSSLYGGMSGTGIKGAEKERLAATKDDRIKRRVYFYPHTGSESSLPKPEQGLGIHAYESKLTNMFDARKHSKETNQISAKAKEYTNQGEHPSNAFERAVLDSGYHGYHTSNMSVVMNKDVPVKYIGTSIGKQFINPINDTAPQKHSIFDSAESKEGQHTSSMLNNDQVGYFLKNKSELQKVAPSLKMEFGRLKVHKDHVDALKQALDKNGQHPL